MSGLSEPTRKGWTAPTLDRLGVHQDADDRWLIHTATGTLRYADDGRKPKMIAEAGSARSIWPVPEVVEGDVLLVVEGEPDAISATELGYAAVALPGVGKADPGWPARIAAGRRHVYLVPDCDTVGRTRMRRVAEETPADVFVYVLDLAPERDDGYDLGDLLMDYGRDGARTVLDAAMDVAEPWAPEAPATAPPLAENGPREVVRVNLGTIPATNQQHLWRPYLPLGKVVLVAGAPGHGKSQLTALFAALTTRASFYPSDVSGPGRVVIVTAEDDLADTVVPRLMAANADLSMIDTLVVRQRTGALTSEGLIQLPGDVPALHAELERGGARLVVLDPVVSFFGGEHSSLSNQDTRRVLDPLRTLASMYACTIVAIIHLNKAAEVREFASRIAESHGFQAVARVVLALGPDPDDPDGDAGDLKVLAITKANLARRAGTSLRLRIVDAHVVNDAGAPVATSRIEIEGTCNVAADDLLWTGDQRAAYVAAREFIEDYLADRWAMSGDLDRDASKAGHAKRTVDRVRKDRCKTQKQPGVKHGAWWVALQEFHPPLVPPYGTVGALGTDNDANDAKDAVTPVRDTGAVLNGDPQDSQDRQQVIDFRREWEIRNPGERWDS